MSDMPERIWLDWPGANHGEPIYTEPPERDTQAGQTEYIRADIVQALTADNARLREERDAILSDSTIHSDQREKYERLCARIAAGKASQQDAVDAIQQLCRDNERLALRRSDDRAALKGESHE